MIPMVDLQGQYQILKTEIDAALAVVLIMPITSSAPMSLLLNKKPPHTLAANMPLAVPPEQMRYNWHYALRASAQAMK